MKKILNFLIILYVLFIIVNPSTGIKLKEDSSYNNLYEIDNLKELLSGKFAYAWTAALGPHGEGPCYFDLDNPGDIIQLATYMGPQLPVGGTWTNDGRWLAVDYFRGYLYEMYPETGEMIEIGGGGVNLSGLAYNPVDNKLYAAASYSLYEIDIETGEQSYIGDFVNGSDTMVSIAFDEEGILYGWDTGNDSLWTIDIETGHAALVGPLGIDIKYSQDGAFDIDSDILYLAAYTVSPNYGGYLYKCDEDTGNCILVGKFEGGAELTALAIPYNWTGPNADFTCLPPYTEPCVPVTFDALESYDPDGYITLYEWDWDNDGVFDENHTIPTTTHFWQDIGDFPVTLRITDNDSLTGEITKYVRIRMGPMEVPVIFGSKIGKVEVEYNYNFVQTNPEGDDISYFIDWGDNTTTGWTGYYGAGEAIIRNHTWYEKGDYLIKAKVKDIVGRESSWGFIEVTMPKTYNPMWWLNNLLNRFPLLQRLLGWLMW